MEWKSDKGSRKEKELYNKQRLQEKFHDDPDSSKREDTCKHEYGSSDFQDDPILESCECNKCGYVMRYSDHCGNTVREVQ